VFFGQKCVGEERWLAVLSWLGIQTVCSDASSVRKQCVTDGDLRRKFPGQWGESSY
jgi:hypothetical protein